MDEAMAQPAVLSTLLREIRKEDTLGAPRLREIMERAGIRHVYFVGMGSSLFASYIPCAYLRKHGILSDAVEANEFLRYFGNLVDQHTMIVAVSQSGNSMETVALCERYREFPNLVTVTNQKNGFLYPYGASKFLIHCGEDSHTATKSYINTIVALQYIAHIIAGDSAECISGYLADAEACIPIMQGILDNEDDRIRRICSILLASQYIVLVGSGPSYCTVSHGELILLEMSKTVSLRYTPAQFIHGPVELIADDFCAVLFDFDPDGLQDLEKISGLLRSYGGKTILITNRRDVKNDDSTEVYTIPCTNRYLSPILEIIPILLAAYEIGIHKDLTPGVLCRVHK
jgi:glucosamine--fructose-6-phosphate aminotransferase (isomerizing)